MITPALSVFLFIAPLFSNGNPISGKQQQCEEINITMCKSLPYNRTRLPNTFEHETQSMARRKLEDLAQRIDQKICSEDLVFFVCSLYLPLCVDNQDIKEPIKPCREVCEKVKSDCDATVKSIARANDTFHELDCGQLVTYDEGVCLTPRAFIRPSRPSRNTTRNTSQIIRKRDFLDASFDFVIKGRISSINQASSGYNLTVNVSRVIMKKEHSFATNVAKVWSQNLYTRANPGVNSRFEIGKEYVILGHKNNAQRLEVGWALTLPRDKNLLVKLKDWKRHWIKKNSRG